jgi:hypothetical protein
VAHSQIQARRRTPNIRPGMHGPATARETETIRDTGDIASDSPQFRIKDSTPPHALPSFPIGRQPG